MKFLRLRKNERFQVGRNRADEYFSILCIEPFPHKIQKVAQDVRSDISKIRNKLPADIEEPIVSEQKARFPIISVSIAGEVQRESLRRFALELRDDLELISGVDSVVTSGLGDPVFWIKVNSFCLLPALSIALSYLD